MHIDISPGGDWIQEYDWNSTTVFRGQHKGREVAIMMLRLYSTSNLEKCIKVSIKTPCIAKPLTDTRGYRIFTKKLFRGGTFGTRTYCHCWV